MVFTDIKYKLCVHVILRQQRRAAMGLSEQKGCGGQGWTTIQHECIVKGPIAGTSTQPLGLEYS